MFFFLFWASTFFVHLATPGWLQAAVWMRKNTHMIGQDKQAQHLKQSQKSKQPNTKWNRREGRLQCWALVTALVFGPFCRIVLILHTILPCFTDGTPPKKVCALSSGTKKWSWLHPRVKSAVSGKGNWAWHWMFHTQSNSSLTVVQSVVNFLWS